jgi:hypothetical protein
MLRDRHSPQLGVEMRLGLISFDTKWKADVRDVMNTSGST